MSETREIRYMWPRFDAGGEGSRGGKIIGHTSSGKPIYENHGHSSHDKFTSSEHNEAKDLHRNMSSRKREIARRSPNDVLTKMLGNEVDNHEKQAFLHERSAKRGGVDSPFKSGHKGK